jgi:hypothetical protein
VVTNWLPWLPLAAAGLHIFEEFVFPGGFAAWYRSYRRNAARITPRFLVIMNAALLLACLNIALLGRQRAGGVYWLLISAVQASNGVWHAWASYKTRRYSPGVITGVLVYVPLAVYGYNKWVESGAVPMGAAMAAYAAGSCYHLWSAAYHRPRADVASRTLQG